MTEREWEQIALLSQVSLEKHPEMIRLMEQNEDVRTFAFITPEQNLLRWYALRRVDWRRRSDRSFDC
jgi:hypothetical protein